MRGLRAGGIDLDGGDIAACGVVHLVVVVGSGRVKHLIKVIDGADSAAACRYIVKRCKSAGRARKSKRFRGRSCRDNESSIALKLDMLAIV